MVRAKADVNIDMHKTHFSAYLIEELTYTAQEGVAQHRIDPSRRMSFFKANDWDLHGAVLLTLLLGVFSFYRLVLVKQLTLSVQYGS